MENGRESYEKDAAEEREIRDELERAYNSHPDLILSNVSKVYKRHDSEKVERVRRKMGR